MKCPKCHYLGFDTGDRCRNCGYDFSLLSVPAATLSSGTLSSATLSSATPSSGAPARSETRSADADVALNQDPAAALDRLADVPIDRLAVAGSAPAPVEAGLQARQTDAAASRGADALPLFIDAADDRPLITFPAAPRAPLAVRKTPEAPRVKPAALSRRRATTDEDARLEFPEEPAPAEPQTPPRRPRQAVPADAIAPPCTAGARIGAAMLDLGMLLAVDLVVLYFTLRMAALSLDEWHLLPLAPLIVFLLLVKLAYYWAFTTIGGQTIGKMAMRIRVIADEGIDVDPTLALQRTVLASTTVLTFGAAFLPALVRRDRRAVHDQIAHTRVVALPAA